MKYFGKMRYSKVVWMDMLNAFCLHPFLVDRLTMWINIGPTKKPVELSLWVIKSMNNFSALWSLQPYLSMARDARPILRTCWEPISDRKLWPLARVYSNSDFSKSIFYHLPCFQKINVMHFEIGWSWNLNHIFKSWSWHFCSELSLWKMNMRNCLWTKTAEVKWIQNHSPHFSE